MRAFSEVLALGALFASLTAMSWRTWPDVLIDSLFRMGGTSYTTLIVANLAILAGLGILVHRFFTAACDRLTALVAAIAVFTIFGFADPGMSFNFIAPYAHEATHGLVLSVLMLYAAQRFLATGRVSWAGVAGACLGLTLLTKPEVALAAVAGAGTGILLIASFPGLAGRRSMAALAVFTAALAAGPLAFFAYFLSTLPSGDAVRAVLGAWMPLLRADSVRNALYATTSGFGAPTLNLLRMAQLATIAGTVALVWAAVDLIVARRQSRQSVLALLGVLVSAVVYLALPISVVYDLARALPIVVIGILAVLVRDVVRDRGNSAAMTRLAPLVMWAVLALTLLAKILLNVQLYAYGFVLALPASLLAIASGLWLIPGALRHRGGSGVMFRSLAMTAVGVVAALHLMWWYGTYSEKTFAIGTGGDTIVTWETALTYERSVSPIGPVVAAAIEQIERLSPPEGTFAVFPEGVMLNYLTRRRNPTPYINFMLPELAAFGEAAMVAALDEHPPDLVVIVHRDTSEYGVGFFGRDPRYGPQIMDWVARRYETAALIGSEPLVGPEFGIKILRQRGATEK